MTSILIVGNFLSDFNTSRGVCEELASQLAGSDYTVLTTSNKLPKLSRFFDMTATAWKKRNSYDLALIDVYSGKAFIWAEAVCWILRRAGKPYILTLHGGNLPEFAIKRKGRVKALLNSANAVTTPSKFLYRKMSHFCANLNLLSNPVDINKYEFKLRQNPQPKLIWLRAFHQIYNPVLAPQVLSLLVRDFPDIKLTMIGPDKGDGSSERTKKEAEKLGVLSKINFPGKVSKTEIPDWLNKGDIFLNTTNVDNTPISVIEAMACGLCVVSTDVGGIPDLLDDNKTALLVPPNNAEIMASAVRRILLDSTLAKSLSKNARSQAEKFAWSVVLPQWESLFLKISNNGS